MSVTPQCGAVICLYFIRPVGEPFCDGSSCVVPMPLLCFSGAVGASALSLIGNTVLVHLHISLWPGLLDSPSVGVLHRASRLFPRGVYIYFCRVQTYLFTCLFR